MQSLTLWALLALLTIASATNYDQKLHKNNSSSSSEDTHSRGGVSGHEGSEYIGDTALHNGTISPSGVRWEETKHDEATNDADNKEEKEGFEDYESSTASANFSRNSHTETTTALFSSTTPTSAPKAQESELIEHSSSTVDNNTEFPMSREPEAKQNALGFTQLFTILIKQLDPGTKMRAVVQVLFFHIYIISFFYLFVVLHQGVTSVIDTLRTPLLIYKEVENKEEVKGYPAPTLPPINKDYGYTGGFKTPKGEKVQYMSYPKTNAEEPKPVDKPKQPEMPPPKPKDEKPKPMDKPKQPEPESKPAPAAAGPYGAPMGGEQKPMFQVYHDGGPQRPYFEEFNEPVQPQLIPVFPGIGGGGGDEVSSYLNYPGQIQ